jgi:hypothetical protein
LVAGAGVLLLVCRAFFGKLLTGEGQESAPRLDSVPVAQ